MYLFGGSKQNIPQQKFWAGTKLSSCGHFTPPWDQLLVGPLRVNLRPAPRLSGHWQRAWFQRTQLAVVTKGQRFLRGGGMQRPDFLRSTHCCPGRKGLPAVPYLLLAGGWSPWSCGAMLGAGGEPLELANIRSSVTVAVLSIRMNAHRSCGLLFQKLGIVRITTR